MNYEIKNFRPADIIKGQQLHDHLSVIQYDNKLELIYIWADKETKENTFMVMMLKYGTPNVYSYPGENKYTKQEYADWTVQGVIVSMYQDTSVLSKNFKLSYVTRERRVRENAVAKTEEKKREDSRRKWQP